MAHDAELSRSATMVADDDTATPADSMAADSMAQTSTPELTIPARRMSFDEGMASLPKHFAKDGDLVSSHLIAALSSLFPDGEDFFVRSVRAYRDQITDPVLKRQVAGFIGQESIHGREHRVLNDRLAELGYQTKGNEWLTRVSLRAQERISPPISNLACTAALEHFTATLAEMILTEPRTRELIGNETVRDLFVWHALEESEHKAVAFDVYRAVGGSERTRILTMKVIRSGFVVTLAIQLAVSLAADPATYQKGRLRKSLRRLKDSPLVSRELWRTLRDYDRRDFHPNDHDNTALMLEWRERLFGESGSFIEYLQRPGKNKANSNADRVTADAGDSR